MEEGKVIFGVGLNTKSFENQIKDAENELQILEKRYEELKNMKAFDGQNEDLEELAIKIEKAKNKVIDLKNKQNKIDEQSGSNFWNNFNKGLETALKKISKWSLAIVGIRSAYNAIRNATSTLSQYNDDMANKINGMKLVMATAMEPIVTRLVNLAYKLMTYVNYIAKAWFNVDLFARAGEKSMQKTKKTMQQISKTKAGFDVFNTLGSQKDTSASADTGITFPKMEDVKVPSWIDWIAKNKDVVLGFFKELAVIIGIIGFAKIMNDLIGIGTVLSNLWKFIQPLVNFIGENSAIIAGIVMIASGLALVIDGIINYLKDPTWESFIQILLGIALVAGGVLLIFGGWPSLITLIIGLIVAIGLAIYKNWGKIKETLGAVGSWIYEHIIRPVKDLFGNLFEWIATGAVKAYEGITRAFGKIGDFMGKVLSKIGEFLKNLGTKAGEVVSNAFKNVVNSVLWAIERILNAPIRAINGLIGVINKVPGINLGTLTEFNLPRLKVGGIINNPGKGVLVGGGRAIGGEGSGQEGVLPLTDNQRMEYLGQAIGKYVRINNYIENNMDSKRINRITKSSSNNRNFALNRG